MKFIYAGTFLTFLFFFSSCIPDHCKDTACANGGLCVEGNCACLSGYEGADCAEIWNKRFLGDWHSADNRGDTAATYWISTVSNGRPSEFLIMNFNNRFDSLICRRKSYNEFVFAENQTLDSVTVLKSGSGMIDTVTAKITSSYTVQRQDTTIVYNRTWTK